MNIEGLTEAISAGIGAAVAVGAAMRHYWSSREIRQQIAFRRSVEQIVDAKTAEILERQRDFETRQGQHLNRQDIAIAAMRRDIRHLRNRNHDGLPRLE